MTLLDFDWGQFRAEASSPPEEITLSFLVPDQEAEERILAQIRRIEALLDLKDDRRGRGEALLRMADVISTLEDDTLK